jgi:hypothetical protein
MINSPYGHLYQVTIPVSEWENIRRFRKSCVVDPVELDNDQVGLFP